MAYLEPYLISKKIDPKAFKKGDPELYDTFERLLSQMHPESFTAQKLFLINKLRREYKIQKEPEDTAVKKPKPIKPKIIPKKPSLPKKDSQS